MDVQEDEHQIIEKLLPALFEVVSRNRTDTPVQPELGAYRQAEQSLVRMLPDRGIGLGKTIRHLEDEVVPGLNGGSLSPNYYGFVIGGTTPAAAIADNFVTAYDQNVAIHMPHDTISTVVEDVALQQVLQLLDLSPGDWPGRIMTTGATASNILGLACGREQIVNKALQRKRGDSVAEAVTVSQLGLLEASRLGGIEEYQILTVMAHSSLYKSASIVGLGRACVKDVGSADVPWTFDLNRLEEALAKSQKTASIVVISCGEVNTGRFNTTGLHEMRRIRQLCDSYNAWLHIDGAFGLFARALGDKDEFATLRSGVAGMELADSITVDGHKLLNVPYDSGFFFAKDISVMKAVFQNPNAAYLTTGSGSATIPSALNLGIENSRRFRALPVYSTLLAYGRKGYRGMLERQVRLARAVATAILKHPAFDLLGYTEIETDDHKVIENVFIIVLFRAKDEELNNELARKINSYSRIYVSSSKWEGRPAARIAVSNWRVDVERDLKIILEVLENVVR